MKNYQISLQLNFKLTWSFSIWIQCNICTKLLGVWQIHFEFEHFTAIVPISVISIYNYQISLQLNFKLTWSISIWIQYNICTKLLGVWQIHFEFETFHCNCPYSSDRNEEIPYVIETKYQSISELSGNVFIVIYAT